MQRSSRSEVFRPRGMVRDAGATPHIPSPKNRAVRESVSPGIYRARNLVERLINRLKHFRRLAPRDDKTTRNYLAAVTLAAIRLWARSEAATWAVPIGPPSLRRRGAG